MSPSWEDLDQFLDPADFGVRAVIETQDGLTRAINGIFDDPYLNAETGEFDMDTRRPRLLCKETDLIGVDRLDSVTVGGKRYDVVTGPQSTGDGMSCLELAEP